MQLKFRDADFPLYLTEILPFSQSEFTIDKRLLEFNVSDFEHIAKRYTHPIFRCVNALGNEKLLSFIDLQYINMFACNGFEIIIKNDRKYQLSLAQLLADESINANKAKFRAVPCENIHRNVMETLSYSNTIKEMPLEHDTNISFVVTKNFESFVDRARIMGLSGTVFNRDLALLYNPDKNLLRFVSREELAFESSFEALPMYSIGVLDFKNFDTSKIRSFSTFYCKSVKDIKNYEDKTFDELVNINELTAFMFSAIDYDSAVSEGNVHFTERVIKTTKYLDDMNDWLCETLELADTAKIKNFNYHDKVVKDRISKKLLYYKDFTDDNIVVKSRFEIIKYMYVKFSNSKKESNIRLEYTPTNGGVKVEKPNSHAGPGYNLPRLRVLNFCESIFDGRNRDINLDILTYLDKTAKDIITIMEVYFNVRNLKFTMHNKLIYIYECYWHCKKLNFYVDVDGNDDVSVSISTSEIDTEEIAIFVKKSNKTNISIDKTYIKAYTISFYDFDTKKLINTIDRNNIGSNINLDDGYKLEDLPDGRFKLSR